MPYLKILVSLTEVLFSCLKLIIYSIFAIARIIIRYRRSIDLRYRTILDIVCSLSFLASY